MRQVRLGVVLAWALTLLLLSAPVHAQETRAAKPELEEKAMAVLKRMAEFLSQAQRFSVTLDIGFDAVQDSGQKIEFGETRQIVLRRPDHLRVDATKRDGAKSTLLFDGKDITVFHPQENVYATVAKPGSVDEAIAYFVQDLDMRLPLAELLTSQLAQRCRSRCGSPTTSRPRRLRACPVITWPCVGTRPTCRCGWRKASNRCRAGW